MIRYIDHVSETTILLNHLSNEIDSLQNQIDKAPAGEPRKREPGSFFNIDFGEKTKGDLELELDPIQQADILMIIPKDWKSDIEQQYTSIEHTYKPELHTIEEEEVVSSAIAAGLAPPLQ